MNSHAPKKNRVLPTIRPPRLNPEDTIGIVSPAGPVNESDLEKGLDLIRSSGFKVFIAPHVFERDGYLAAKDEDRLKDLHTILLDPNVKAVFCSRGGYGSMRILDRIDYALITKNPKIIVGYSDITAFLMAIYVHTGLVTFHGPMVRGLDQNNGENWIHLIKLLSNKGPVETDLKGCSVLIPGAATGRLMGGNLSLICHLTGTRFMPSLEGTILFLEETGESLYRLDRMLTHLRLTGMLSKVNAVIAGQFKDCGDTEKINHLLESTLSDLEIPLISEFPIGHGSQNLTLPVGLMADLDTTRLTMTIKEACVK